MKSYIFGLSSQVHAIGFAESELEGIEREMKRFWCCIR